MKKKKKEDGALLSVYYTSHTPLLEHSAAVVAACSCNPLRIRSSSLSLLLDPLGKPVKALIETLARRGAGGLYLPRV
jgi:hypothetical protein